MTPHELLDKLINYQGPCMRFCAYCPEDHNTAEIKECVEEYNNTLATRNHKIEAWMGIHFGKMIIGTIGEENRLDDTVISDTVNTASRIESVCEKLEKPIIVSQALVQKLQEKSEKITASGFSLERLEDVHVKGKEMALQIYEVKEK